MPRRRRMERMLTIYRRHAPACPHRDKGSAHLKCDCPLWAWGSLPNGRWTRKSLGTRSISQARRVIERWERDQRTGAPPSVEFATEAFLLKHKDSACATRIKYAKVMRLFRAFSERTGHDRIDAITVETFDHYRETRDIAPLTWVKELQVLRSFCEFCVRRDWLRRNFAREVETPKGLWPSDREPYSEAEMVAILKACERIGQEHYERLRARALVLAMRYAGLSIRDAYLLRRDATCDGCLEVRRAKNGKPVSVPVPLDLAVALEAVPLPQGAAANCPYYFYSPGRNLENAIRRASRTLKSVFRTSGVANAKSHRFRHTLATRMLEQGASFEDVAAVLGNSARIVEKHYAKWSKGRQERINRYFRAAHGMNEENRLVH